jgi:hypothetical protein
MPTKRKTAPAYDCEKYHFAMMLGVPHPSKEMLAELKPIWKQCGPGIMAAWMEDRENPGERPFAWWQFDTLEKRDPEKFPNQWDFLAEHSLLEPWERVAVDAQWMKWFGEKYWEK